ncbi:MAG: (S)-ureidoglycine aminohydrolase [Rhodobacterales bacterium]|nr:(S)-ureidoglycine aminohydrolase [Rhodobacterales bacterium]
MRQKFGETRSRFSDNHALISGDSHERTTLPNWPDTALVFVIAPQMGARFTEFFAHMPEGAKALPPLGGIERFFFVLDGTVELTVAGTSHRMEAEGYAFLPADTDHRIRASTDARLIVLERPYVPLASQTPPPPHIGNCKALTAVPMKGDTALMLKKLLPETLAFDCEVNVMDFSPGASLPYVETHFMEHGLLFLNGGGIYRLDDRWYPVDEGDIIWMGPYCPQWFGAIGKTNARYLIYKNWNRDPHTS